MNKDEQSKTRWACRRGMLELDKLLLTFFDKTYEQMSDNGRKIFNKLLTNADQDLYKWLLGSECTSDPSLQDMVLMIRHVNKY